MIKEFSKIAVNIIAGSLILLLCVSLGGCSVQQHVPVYTEVQKTPLNLPPYDEIKFEEVQFKVISYEEKSYFALDTDNYSKLSRNMVTIQNYIKYLKNSVKEYQDYYEGDKDARR